MKKFIFLIFSIFICSITYSQDIITLKHKNYTSFFSKSKSYPVMVEWWLTKDEVGCSIPVKRKNNFSPDPLLPKETDLGDLYYKSGFDRGHMCPSADRTYSSADNRETFLMTNMIPQAPNNNQRTWVGLENYERTLVINKNDSIHIWCGCIGEIGKIGKMSIPKYFWKVIFFKKENIYMYFVFENTKNKADGLKNNEVSKKYVEELTGFKFKKN